MIAHGWASGLAGTPNNSTADAPKGAASNGRLSIGPPKNQEITPVKKIRSARPGCCVTVHEALSESGREGNRDTIAERTTR
jgi:hypothetical protein